MASDSSSNKSTASASSSEERFTAVMKKKRWAVILVSKNDEESRRKALTIAGCAKGVTSARAALGSEKLEVRVVGAGVDWGEMSRKINKMVGPASLMEMGEYYEFCTIM